MAHEHNHLRTKLLGVDEEINTKTRSQQKTSRRVDAQNRFFERNMETVNNLLPFPVAFGLPPAARNGYTMRMRIVDFIRHQDAKFEIAAWARQLGFVVIVDEVSEEQPSCECGYIGVGVTTTWRASAEHWLTADVDDANSPTWVDEGNRLLNLPRQRTWWLTSSQITKYAAITDPRNELGEGIAELFSADWGSAHSPFDGLGQLPWLKV